MSGPPPRERRDCRCPRARHEHGTLRAYQADQCRCFPCRWAHADARAAHRRGESIAYYSLPFTVGVARRIEALHALGWTCTDLAGELGCTKQAVRSLRQHHGARTLLTTLTKVDGLYQRLSGTPRVGTEALKMRNRAHRYGWHPPLAWDDDTIDDPAARPQTRAQIVDSIDEVAVSRAMQGDSRVRLTKAERSEAFARLDRMGYSAREIGELLGVTGRTIVRKRSAAA